MKTLTVTALCCALSLAAVLPAFAGDDSSMKFNGTFYFDYFVDLTDREDDDQTVTRGFDPRRVYATVKKSWGDMAFRYTTDINFSSDTGNLNVYSKYAYLEHKGLIPNAKVLIGQHSPKTHGWIEKRWHYRSMAKTMSDGAKWSDSATFGVGVQGKAKEGMFEYYLDLNNGNGYKKPVVKDGLGFAARAVAKPADGFYISGLFSSNTPGGFTTLDYDVDEDNTIEADVAKESGDIYFEGLVGYDVDRFAIYAQYGMFTDNNVFTVDDEDFNPDQDDFPTIVEGEEEQTGLSIFGRALLTEGTYAVARYDMVDPNTDVDDDGYNWILVGLDHEVHEGFFLQPSVRITSFEEDDADSETEFVLTFFGKI